MTIHREHPARDPSGSHSTTLSALGDALATGFGSEMIVEIGSTSEPRVDTAIHRVHLGPEAFLMALDDLDAYARATMLCVGVLDEIADPRSLLSGFRAVLPIVDVLVIDAEGWTIDRLAEVLDAEGLTPTLLGYAPSTRRPADRRSAVAVLDHFATLPIPPADGFRVEALVACFNERDIIGHCVADLLAQEVDVTVIDDWSTDGTFEMLTERFGQHPRVRLLRHGDAPSSQFAWRSVLRMKEQLAAASTADWFIHQDADELRRSPWPGTTLRTGLWRAQAAGFNAVDHTVIDFRPTESGYTEHHDPGTFFRHFEFGRRPGHFQQVKAWRSSPSGVDLASSGGHDAGIEHRRVLPYKFLLQHYPLRSPVQARRKIFEERTPRWSEERRQLGWHTHYDRFSADDRFMWDPETLTHWDRDRFEREFLVERLTGIGLPGHPLDVSADHL